MKTLTAGPSGSRGRQCIVIEHGSASPYRVPPAIFEETAVIAQSTSESANAFAHRVLSRIAAMERLGRRFQTMAVLTAERHDRASKAARRLIVLALAAHVRAFGQPAELVLRSRPSATDDERRELLELAGEATESTSALSVKVKFDELLPVSGRRRSGVFARSACGDASNTRTLFARTVRRRWPEAT